ncbi:cupin domain-containing protein [Radiobacillus deserti]|uniref:Cupin domain-containing protein n=1 Tax=Radiobacillus deserti TaxID=2594883 RepID=A0A516KDA6_9BACI|nr:cupin domain-containing protein [Radiobacillus deserti]QDP39394.1 cupin domain-containing protein [Radiobacillus deserti]
MNYNPYSYYPNYGNDPRYSFNNPPPSLTPHAMEQYQFVPYQNMGLQDFGQQPYVVNINEATRQNNTYRTALWTGKQLQTTLMSLRVGEDIGLEMHPNVDQFLRVEQGQGIVQMGKSRNNLTYQQRVYEDSAIFIPAGTWHNLTNTGRTPLKLYSIYAPPNHPFGTVQVTKADAMAVEEQYM